MSEFEVEKLDWPAQSLYLNQIEHLWDELEQRLRARPSSAAISSLQPFKMQNLYSWFEISANGAGS